MEKFLAYLQKTEQAKKQESEGLKVAGRTDEANLVKLEINLIGIFRAVYETAEKAGFDFVEKINAIKAPWEERLTLAKAHGDFETEAQEERKLAMHETLLRGWEESKK